jgi:hypothetical protein
MLPSNPPGHPSRKATMVDITTTASFVSKWTASGIKLPKAVAAAVGVFDAISGVEVGHTVTFDLEGVTADNAEAKVRAFAEQSAPTLPTVPNGGINHTSPLAAAKRQALTAAARAVVAGAATAVPEIIKQLTPEFAAAAAEFTEAVLVLPGDLADAALVAAGPAVLADYHRALTAQQVIARHDSWLGPLAQLPGLGGSGPDPTLRVLRPADHSELLTLDNLRGGLRGGSFGQLNPLYATAARAGIKFGLNTPREAAQIRSSLADVPVPAGR